MPTLLTNERQYLAQFIFDAPRTTHQRTCTNGTQTGSVWPSAHCPACGSEILIRGRSSVELMGEWAYAITLAGNYVVRSPPPTTLTMKRMLITFIACALIFGAYLLMAVLDQLPDRRQEAPEADQLELNFKRKDLEARINKIARWKCGNAHYELIDPQTIKCTPRRGGKAYIVSVN